MSEDLTGLGRHQRGVLLSAMGDRTAAAVLGWSMRKVERVREALRTGVPPKVANLPAVVAPAAPPPAPVTLVIDGLRVPHNNERVSPPGVTHVQLPSERLPMADQIAEYRELVEDLRRQLLDQRGTPEALMSWHLLPIHLTGAESRILGRLWRSAPLVVSRGQLHDCLYADDIDGGAEVKIIDVFICKLRKKLARLEVSIGTSWGRGYFIPTDDRDRLRALALEKAGELVEAERLPELLEHVPGVAA